MQKNFFGYLDKDLKRELKNKNERDYFNAVKQTGRDLPEVAVACKISDDRREQIYNLAIYGKKDSVAEVYRQFVLFLYNLDPWLVCEAFDGEDEQEYAARVSVGMDIDSVESEIEQARGLVDGETDNMEKLAGFAKRIEALKRA